MAQAKQAQVIITANASVAERVMQELEGAATRASNRMKALADAGAQIKERMRQLASANKQNTDEYKQLDAQLKQNNKDFKAAEKEFQAFNSRLRENVKDSKRVEEVMKQLATTATRDLRRAFQAAKRELEKMSEKDPRRQQLIQDMKKIQQQIDTNTGSIKKQQGAWGALGTTMKNLFAYAGIFAAFNKLKGLFEDVIQKNREMSDQLANIRKVSGLAMSDINGLAKNLAKIDTRTSVQGLNDLAYVGAKLGFGNLGTEALESFVKSALKVENALKEDLGEDSMMAISKLVEVMGLIPKMGVEKAMDSAGSAIFKLASTSTATGANIIEFSKRLMGLANVSHITTDQLLALGSASDAMGLMPEVSATAFNKVFTSIQSNTRAIEQSLQMQKGELTELINEGKTMEAIVTVFDKMHGMNMDQLKAQGVFKALGSDGARLNNVMITMSDRIDMLKTHLHTSNQAFSEGSAVAQEYAIQMETAEAYMQRAANMWEKAFVNPEGVDLTKEFAKAWYDLSKALTQSEANAIAIKIILQGVFGIMKLIVEMIPALITGFATWGMFAGGAAMISKLKEVGGLLTLISTTIRGMSFAGWAGIITGVAMGVYTLYSHFKSLNDELQQNSEFMKGFKKNLSDLNTEYGKGEAELRRYKRAIDEANKGSKQRMAAIQTFNSKFGQYMKNMLTEKSTALDVAKAYNEVSKALRAKLALQLKEKDINEQVLPREQWRAERRTEYDQRAQQAGFGQYGANWITAYAQDNKGKSIDTLVRTIGKQYYNLPQQIVDEVAKQAAAGNREFNNNGNIINSRYLDQANALLSAGSFLRQDRAAENAMRKVDKKWKPEQDAIDAYVASQNKQEPITPIDGDRLTKDEIKELRKEEQEAKKALRKEMEDAQKDSTAVINSIEEFYRLQESLAEQLVADGKLTRGEADKLIEYIRNRKDEMLLEARRAITGNENQFESLRKEMGKDLLRPDDTASQRAMQTVQTVDVNKAAQNLKKFDGGNDVYGLNSGSFTQSVLKNAAQNELNIQRRQAKVQEEVDKLLMQFRYVEQAQRSFGDQLVNLGLITAGYEKVVQQLADGTAITANSADVQRLGQKVTGIGTRLFNVDPSDAEELRNMVDAIMTTVDADGKKIRESFATMFPNLDEWMENPEQYKEQMQAFYKTLLDYDQQYYNAIKQSYDNQKKLFETRWETSGKGQVYANTAQEIDIAGRKQKLTGADQGTNFGEQAGFLNIENDPEVQASLLRMAQMQDELEMFRQVNEQKKLEGEELLAFQQGLAEKQREVDEAEMAMQEALMQHINEHISKLSEWTQPIEQFGADVGSAMGKALFESENMADGMRNALQSLVRSWGESTIQIVKNLMMQQLKQKLIGKTMVKDKKDTEGQMSDTVEEGEKERFNVTSTLETGAANIMQQVGDKALATKQTQDAAQNQAEAGKAQGSVLAGIAEGAAKIIGMLGPFGAPLIAVITALLMGLLNTALAALTGGGSDKGNNANQTNRKIKLAQGMLTYDEGNVQTVVGDDGRVYRARSVDQLPAGVSMVTEPIATRVNGQQALVGERGPEIVIGRRTTRALQMNRPDLLRALSLFDRGYTGHQVRTFDEGNISDMATAFASAQQPAVPAADGNASAERQALIDRLDRSDALMQQVLFYLQNPVAPNIDMYGDNGLHKKLKQADKFLSRYGG